jgi:intraflagellar transport protein 20
LTYVPIFAQAIGLRYATETESEQRTKQQRALQAVINEKRAELDRYVVQCQSLERIEADQRATLERMTNARTSADSRK